MRADRSLTLIVSGVDRDLALARESAAARWPALAQLAGRGDVMRLPAGMDASASILAALALEPEAYPEAAVLAAGAALNAREYWLRATPMHFAAGLNDLRATPLRGEQGMSDEEAERLKTMLGSALEAEGFTMIADGQGNWLLRSVRALDASMSSPHAASMGLEASMPRGADAALLKRLMTELQMLLHEHPVNRVRVREGRPEINAIWLHGGGSAGAVQSRTLPAAFGDDPFLRGVYALHGAAAPAPIRDGSQIVQAASARSLASIQARTLDELESRWLVPLLTALRSGALQTLDLVLDHWRISLERRALLKFWRGPKAPAQWPA